MPARAQRHSDQRGHQRRVALAVALGLVLGLVGGAAGGWWGTRQAEVHEATAVILLNPLQGNPFSPDARGDDLVNLETEAQLVTSDTVLDQLAAARPDAPVVEADAVSVTVPTNTQLLSIAVSSGSVDEAQDAAQQLATIYLTYRQSRTSSALFNERANIDEQIVERARERAALVERLDDLQPGSPGSSLLTQQILAAVTQISELRTQLGEVGSASLDPGQVVTPARVTTGGLLPRGPLVPAVLGALLGIACGVLVATQTGRRRNVVRTRDDLADLPATVWGGLPDDEADEGVAHDAAARLRAAVLATHPAARLLVLTCRSGPPALSAASTALARSLAAARIRTVLVELADADDRDASAVGITQVLRDQATLDDAIAWDGDLGRMTAGRDSAGLDDLAAAPEMSVLVLELREDCQAVVVSGAAPGSPRTQALAGAADLVLLEVPIGVASRADVEADLDDLATAGAARVGLVLVACSSRRSTTRLPGTSGARGRRVGGLALQQVEGALIALSRRLVRLSDRRSAAGQPGSAHE